MVRPRPSSVAWTVIHADTGHAKQTRIRTSKETGMHMEQASAAVTKVTERDIGYLA
jgi:hypothetical protein